MSSLRSLRLAAAGLMIATAAVSGLVSAQTARTGGGASAQLLQQLQQLASERTSLQSQNAQMKKELDDVRKERDALKKAQQAVDGRVKAGEAALARTATERESKEQELKQAKDRMQELIGKFRETVQTLREVETEHATAKQTLASREQDLKVCTDHNTALYKLNEEVLTRLEHQSAWSRVASAEPFTKLKRVELENLVDEYKFRADEQRLKSPAVAAPEKPRGQ